MQEKIIEALKKAQGYLSGEELSDHLKVSRSAVWKCIQELRTQDYDIIAVPHLGYKINACPDKLLPAEVQFNLNTKILGKKILHYDSIGSTMDEAFKLGSEGASEGTVVVSETQTKGRGRLGRSWASPKGKGIYLSVILRPDFAPNEIACLTLLCAVAVSEAIKNICGITAYIKWPNDLLVNYKKVAGILTELNAETDRIKFVVIGIGINVNTLKSHLPEGSTSLYLAVHHTVARIELTQEVLRRIEKRYLELKTKGFNPTIEKWKELSFTLNKFVRVIDASGTTEGEAIGVDRDGGLLIRKNSGIVVKKMAGDVVQVR
jgi:BirA family biotin operon repressor/biotin-[acetyl-CoA-carboxylase] ligase